MTTATSISRDADLERVETLLQQTLDRLPEPGRTGCLRIIGAGGKRLRPELVLRCAAVLQGAEQPPASEAVIAAAVAVEILHSATLMHDDLLDDSDTRRGVPAIHRLEGLPAAVIAGDALIAQSWMLIAQAGRESVEDLATALADMCAGEALEDQLKFSPEALPLDVLRVSQLKTGALLKAACRIGARLAGCSPTQIDAIGTFGSDFGVALQLVDDVLDVISDEATLGKPCAADFPAGTVTMPAVYAMGAARAGRGDLSRELRALLRPGLRPEECARAQQLIIRSGSPMRAVELARSFARRAARTVPGLGEQAAAMAAMPGEFVERQLDVKVAAAYRWALTPPSATDGLRDQTPSDSHTREMLGDAG